MATDFDSTLATIEQLRTNLYKQLDTLKELEITMRRKKAGRITRYEWAKIKADVERRYPGYRRHNL